MKLSRYLLSTAVVALVALPAAAAQRPGAYADQNAFRVRLGEFAPRGDGDYWIDKRFDFTGDERDFEDLLAGVDYLRFLGPRLGLLVSGNSYESEVAQEYLDFVDEFGFPISHTTTLEVASLNFGLIFHLTRRGATVAPYVGGGGGLYGWRLIEDGDFIDFGNLEIFTDRFEQTDEAFGWFVVAGLEVPVSDTWRVFAEGRWHRVDDDLAGDFEGLGELDLSGRTISFGAGWSF